MNQKECAVRHELNQITNVDEGVADAIGIARAWIDARGNADGSRGQAIRRLAFEARLSASGVRSLLQPSRVPKSVSASFLRRLRAAYLKWLQNRVAQIETEIARVESMDSGDRAYSDLVARAEACLDQIKAAIPKE